MTETKNYSKEKLSLEHKTIQAKALEGKVKSRLALLFSPENSSEVYLSKLKSGLEKDLSDALKEFEKNAEALSQEARWEKKYPFRSMFKNFFNTGWNPLTKDSANEKLMTNLNRINTWLVEIRKTLEGSLKIEETDRLKW